MKDRMTRMRWYLFFILALPCCSPLVNHDDAVMGVDTGQAPDAGDGSDADDAGEVSDAGEDSDAGTVDAAPTPNTGGMRLVAGGLTTWATGSNAKGPNGLRLIGGGFEFRARTCNAQNNTLCLSGTIAP